MPVSFLSLIICTISPSLSSLPNASITTRGPCTSSGSSSTLSHSWPQVRHSYLEELSMTSSRVHSGQETIGIASTSGSKEQIARVLCTIALVADRTIVGQNNFEPI